MFTASLATNVDSHDSKQMHLSAEQVWQGLVDKAENPVGVVAGVTASNQK